MHGYSAVHNTLLQQFFHLLMAFFVILYLHRSDAIRFQCADVVYVHTRSGRFPGCRHGVLFSVLRAHAGQGDLRTGAEAARLQTVRNLSEDPGDHLFCFSCHGYASSSVIRLAAKSRIAFAIRPFTSSSETPPSAPVSAAVLP